MQLDSAETATRTCNGAPGKASVNAISPTTATARYYRPELDWLRFMAFSMVFLLHGFPDHPEEYTALGVPAGLAQYVIVPLFLAGGYGVDLFFALSAFLITELLLTEKELTGRVHIQSFYLRRILRIWPLYITFILVALAYEVPTKGYPLMYYVSLLAFTGNWYITAAGGVPSLCGNLWSVCIEEQFYLVWPNLVGRAKRARFVAILTGILIFTILFRCLYVYGTPPFPYQVWYNTFTRLDCFALGGLLACAMHKRNWRAPFAVRILIFAVGVFVFWLIGRQPYGGYFGYFPAWTYPLAGLGSVLFILSFVLAPTREALSWPLRLLSYLGKISYGLYVFHGPALRFCERELGTEWPSHEWSWVVRTTLAAVLTLIVSMLSYAILEKPFLRMKGRFTFVRSRPV